ncbi:MAG: type VII toxin-antitoxin system HepT family RNase toxin [Actinomycetota bacterium]
MVDPGRLRALLDRLGEESGHLRRMAERPAAELLADEDALAAAKYRFVVAIETCIDAGEHVIASEGLEAPSSFAKVFRVLAASGYLHTDIGAELERMARFRNLLVHGYQEVDDRRVVEILQTRLGDFDVFREQLAGRALE